ncbi:LysR family transcriptional regulator [Acidovorax sp. SUPP3334]|uniref:LysR family transcriptional regulator n=1 Tax=Acidovorax sp. SUPP3334 TaxID=2920881 RepID=UPI0023DE6689|nr:LysR family transcriptional regulator [Acidovorax sp. SUPP3334]GKT23065.1 LysR family transcriptional regulator [Acidovorax sp. SUPP3334]
MNLRFVEAFHWAASLKSITRAAEKLHITQSALSSRIAALEDELGVILLDRRERIFRLTAAGQRFQLLAVRLLELQRQVKEELGTSPHAPVALRIGAIESVVHSWLTGWLQEVRKTRPDFELELTVETSPVLVDQVRRGAQDLVFTSIPATDTAVRTRLMPSLELVFVGHKSLHAAGRYDLQRLAQHDLITFQRGSHPHQALLQLFQESEVAVPRIHAISSISAMLQLIEAGFGIAVLPRAVTQRLSHRMPLHILRASCTLADLPIHASYREDPGSGITESVLESAQAYVANAKPARKKRTQG